MSARPHRWPHRRPPRISLGLMESSAGIAERGAPVGGVDRPVARDDRCRSARQPSRRATAPADRPRPRLPGADEAADHLAAALDHGRDDVRRPPERPRPLDRPLDLPRRLSGRRRRRRDQPLHRPRHRRPRWAAPRAGRSSPAGSSRSTRSIFGISLGAIAATVQLWITVNALAAAPGPRRPARLRPALHGLAEAPDAAEHRHRRRRRRDAAAGRLGGGHRQPDARRALPVPDHLPLDPAPLLGPGAADLRRLRADRDSDDARRPRRGATRAAGSSSTRCCWSRSRSFRSRPGCSAALYLAAAAVLGVAFIVGAAQLLRSPSRRAALQLYLGSLAYLFLLFGAMAADRVIAA